MSLLAVPTANRFTRRPTSALQPSATLSQANVFTNAAWTKAACSVTGSQTDPLGGSTASSIVEDNTTAEHRIQQAFGSFNATFPCRLTLYAKAGSRSWIRIGDVSGLAGAWFNVSTGAIGTVNPGSKAYITASTGGYYIITMEAPRLPNATYIINISSADNTFSYAGNGTGNVLVYTAAIQ